MKSRSLLPVVLLLALVMISVPSAAEEVRKPVFVPQELPTILAVVRQPPRPGTPEDLADRQAVVRRQAGASGDDVERAKRSADASLKTLFGKPYGPLGDAEVARWSALFSVVANDTDTFVGQLKRRYRRPRPYAADFRIKSLGKSDKAFAFPSGAAAISAVFGKLLSKLYPSLAKEIERRSLDIGDCRVILGAHHPSDIQAGMELGLHLERLIWSSGAFQAKIREINARP